MANKYMEEMLTSISHQGYANENYNEIVSLYS
jgi:hypothetical protein